MQILQKDKYLKILLILKDILLLSEPLSFKEKILIRYFFSLNMQKAKAIEQIPLYQE